MASMMPPPASATSPATMPMTVVQDKTASYKVTSGQKVTPAQETPTQNIPTQKMASASMIALGQKLSAKKKKKNRSALGKRDRKMWKTEGNLLTTTTTSAKVSARKPEGATSDQEMMAEEKYDEEQLNKIKLDILAKRAEELQGYVNQLQDAVTIGMFQLRDLKEQIAVTTAAIATNTNK